MRKNQISAFIFCIFILPIIILFTDIFRSSVYAQTFYDVDGGISIIHQTNVPQFTLSGKIVNSYQSDSFLPIFMWGMDFGTYNPYYASQQLDSTTSHDTVPTHRDASFNGTLMYSDFPLSTYDHLNQYNFKVFIVVFWTIKQLRENYPADWQTRFRTVIDQYKNHPAVAGYYLFDEGYTGLDESDIQAAYNIIKTAETTSTRPNKPVFANYSNPQWCSETTKAYNDARVADFYHIYGPNQGTEGLANTMRQYYFDCAANFDADTKPFMPILQSFRDQTWQMPTAAQLRNQAYVALADGATGYWWFTHHDNFRFIPYPYLPWNQNTTPPTTGGVSLWVTPGLWSEISKVNAEITANKKVFLSKTATDEYHISTSVKYISGYYPIRTILKNTGEANIRYLLAVNINNTDDPNNGYVTVRFNFPGKTISAVTSVLDNRTVSPTATKDAIEDPFDPLEVMLYRIDFSSTPAPSPLPCPGNVTQSCSSDNSGVSFSWSPVTGSNGIYSVRFDKYPYTDWFNPAGGDQVVDVTGTNTTLNITPGSFKWSIQAHKPNETYPYSGLTCPIEGACPLPYSCTRCSVVNGCEWDTFQSNNSDCLTPATAVVRTTDCNRCSSIAGGNNSRCNACPTPTPLPVRGDANGDGLVTTLDYDIWKSEYLALSSTKTANFNNDQAVDGIDYVIWRNEYRKTL